MKLWVHLPLLRARKSGILDFGETLILKVLYVPYQAGG